MTELSRFSPILETCLPFFVASGESAVTHIVSEPLGLALRATDRIDPQLLDNAVFVDLIQRLDALCYQDRKLRMPRWAFYDCVAVPGGVFGFAKPAGDLDNHAKELLEVPSDYTGLVPLSAWMAMPTIQTGAFHHVAACALTQVLPRAAPAGLVRLSTALGLAALQAQTLFGTTQWRSEELAEHAALGPLHLLTAWTPAHSVLPSLTWRVNLDHTHIPRILAPQHTLPPDVSWIDCDDDDALIALQKEIESGRDWMLVGPAVVDGAYTRAPLLERAVKQ